MTSKRPMRTAPAGPGAGAKKEPASKGHYNKLTSLGVVTDVVEAALKRHFDNMKTYIDAKLEKVDERLESMEGQLEYYFATHDDDDDEEEKEDVGCFRFRFRSRGGGGVGMGAQLCLLPLWTGRRMTDPLAPALSHF